CVLRLRGPPAGAAVDVGARRCTRAARPQLLRTWSRQRLLPRERRLRAPAHARADGDGRAGGGLRRRAPRRAPRPVLEAGRCDGSRLGRQAPQHLQPACSSPTLTTVEIVTRHVNELSGPVDADLAVVIDVI